MSAQNLKFFLVNAAFTILIVFLAVFLLMRSGSSQKPTSIQPTQTPQNATQAQEPQQKPIPKNDKPKVELFVMSFCPYGNQAEELMMQVVKLIGTKADIGLDYVIYSNYQGGGPNYCLDKESKYCSMHGAQEVNQDVRELCVAKYQNSKFWDFVKQINASCTAQNADSCWEKVATNLGIDTAKIKTCEQNEATNLLGNEVSLNQKYGVQGSPQLFINGVEYIGARTTDGYKNTICSAFNTQPDECKQVLSETTASQTPSGGCTTQ